MIIEMLTYMFAGSIGAVVGVGYVVAKMQGDPEGYFNHILKGNIERYYSEKLNRKVDAVLTIIEYEIPKENDSNE